MNDKLELRLITSEIRNYTFDELYSTLANAPEDIVLEVPCPSINTSQYPTDIAYDYLWALFVGENIADFCKSIFFQMEYRNSPIKACFIFRPKNLIDLAHNIYLILPTFDDELDFDN